jgi:hypothetical protein
VGIAIAAKPGDAQMSAETFDRIHDSRPVLFRKIPDVTS